MLGRELLLVPLLLASAGALAGDALELSHRAPRKLEAGDTVQLDFNVIGRYASESPPTLSVHFRVAGKTIFQTIEGIEIGYGLYRVTIPRDRLPQRGRRVTLQYYAELTRGAEFLAGFRNAVEPAVTFIVLPKPEPPPPDATTLSPGDVRGQPRYRSKTAAPRRPAGTRTAPAKPEPDELNDPRRPVPGQKAPAIVPSAPLRRSDTRIKVGLNVGAMFGYEVFSEKTKTHLFEDLWVAWAPWLNVPGEFTLDVMFYLGWFYSVAPGMRYYFVRNDDISHSLGFRALIRFDPDAPVPGGGVTTTIEVGVTKMIAISIAGSFDLTVWPSGSGPVPEKLGKVGESLDYLVVPVFTASGGLMFRF